MAFLDIQNRPLILKNVTINSADIKKADITQEKKDPKKIPFALLVFAFITGALTFAIALAYTNFVDSVIKRYSFGPGILERMINLVVITIFTFIFIYIIWKVYPQGVSGIIK